MYGGIEHNPPCLEECGGLFFGAWGMGTIGNWANKSFAGICFALTISVFSSSPAHAWWSWTPNSQIQSSHERITAAGISLIRDKLTNGYLKNNLDAIGGYTCTIAYDVQAHGGDEERNGGDVADYWSLFHIAHNHNLGEVANTHLGRCIHLIEDMSVPAHAYNIKHTGSGTAYLDRFETVASLLSPDVNDVWISDPDSLHAGDPARYYGEARLNTKSAVESFGFSGYYHTGNHGGVYANWKGDGPKGYYTIEAGIENEWLDLDLFPLLGGGAFVQSQMNEAAGNVAKFLLAVDRYLQNSAGTAAALYFPHVDTRLPWQTEIAVINTSDQTVAGTLMGISNDGRLAETKPVTLPAHGRREIAVAGEFTNHADIGYIILDTDSPALRGYTKFYQEGKYRAAIPAAKEANTSDIYIPHIDSGAQWWTGISLVNTTSATKQLTITFNDGRSRDITLTANQHRAFTIGELFDNQPQPDMKSAVITNASGVIALELFGTHDGKQLEGIPITNKTASTLYYPHVDTNGWWTGIVAYNPSDLESAITIAPYDAKGAPLSPIPHTIAGRGNYVAAVSPQRGFPSETAWFKITATRPLAGFELFGSTDGEQLGAYAGNAGGGSKEGVFAKIEKLGWTGIAFVNTEDGAASVTLTAYADDGTVMATRVLSVNGHAKVVNPAETIFLPPDISGATYIAFSSDKDVMGFQLNGTADWIMLDGLPGM
jgi:hypothetical protein